MLLLMLLLFQMVVEYRRVNCAPSCRELMPVGCVFQASGMTGFQLGLAHGRHYWEVGGWEERGSRGVSPSWPWAANPKVAYLVHVSSSAVAPSWFHMPPSDRLSGKVTPPLPLSLRSQSGGNLLPLLDFELLHCPQLLSSSTDIHFLKFLFCKCSSISWLDTEQYASLFGRQLVVERAPSCTPWTGHQEAPKR